jgi:hypothetical protein
VCVCVCFFFFFKFVYPPHYANSDKKGIESAMGKTGQNVKTNQVVRSVCEVVRYTVLHIKYNIPMSVNM